ncbi:hypothetical protein D4764_02G0006330 [Takifugu flavidus]|uniref:Uncharacterized protein n=1 Tax=Takifugu flavidus TaxID=433684 RepID=A0A5C6NJ12_9TELE|nr:hypothetical protein D4764_02G0006330 [Takifugu flavidus]
MSFLRRVAGLSLRDRVRSSAIREELGVEPLLLRVERSQMRWLGHLVRMPPGRLPGEVFRACPSGSLLLAARGASPPAVSPANEQRSPRRPLAVPTAEAGRRRRRRSRIDGPWWEYRDDTPTADTRSKAEG